MARWPAPRRCKTRLAAGLGPSRAAAVQHRLHGHAVAVLQQAQQQLACDAWLAFSGCGPRGAARLIDGAGLRVLAQGDGCLGLRMQRQFVHAFRHGYGQVLLIGSDLPQLSSADLQQAFAALDQVPAVLGPALDGGYWLIGLNRLMPALLAGMTWGSDQVLQQTAQRAAELGLPLLLLREQGDLDRCNDLTPWRRHQWP